LLKYNYATKWREDDFLANSLVLYIGREIAKSFDLDSILDDFVLLKDRKMQF
jgi:hypothetical protein